MSPLAIALKRRVVILQAVEHAPMDSGNPFENFVRALKADQQRIDQLESEIASVLVRVSALELTRSHRSKDLVVTPGDVDRPLRASHRIHELGNGVVSGGYDIPPDDSSLARFLADTPGTKA